MDRKQPEKLISGSKQKNFMEQFIYIHYQSLLLLQIRFPSDFDIYLF